MPFGSTMLTAHKVIMVDFIQMYKSMPFLWDTSHPSYNDRLLRKKGYQKLLKKYQEIDDEATMPILKGKLDNMRNSYIRELKKVRASKKSNPEMVYCPVLWYYDLFSFLENHVLKKSRSSDRAGDHETQFVYLDDYDDDEGSQSTSCMPVEYLEDTDNSDSGSERPVKKHKVKMEAEDRAEDQINLRDDGWDIIGKAIGVQLRDIEPRQAAIAQKLIAEALFYAKMGTLTEDASIILN